MRFVVIGGGIAGVSVAAELAARVEVTLVEAEPQLAHHTTGRSAAMYLQSYGNPVVRALTTASRGDFDRLADEVPLLAPRALLRIADEAGVGPLARMVDEAATLRAVGADEALDRCPALREDRLAAAALDDSGAEIDVLALHGAYLRLLRSRGGTVLAASPVSALRPTARSWRVEAGEHRIAADAVVDAAGAWADEVAVLAGVEPVGLSPLRRTLFTCPTTWAEPMATWPLVVDAAEAFYFKPEAGGVLVSPADETPSPPCDARPDELDVARALELVDERTTLGLRSVHSAWAGLRTFAADRSPVVGWAPAAPGFAWFAGQGGYGIQMAPALARCAAALLLDGTLPADVGSLGISPGDLAPDRRALLAST